MTNNKQRVSTKCLVDHSFDDVRRRIWVLLLTVLKPHVCQPARGDSPTSFPGWHPKAGTPENLPQREEDLTTLGAISSESE